MKDLKLENILSPQIIKVLKENNVSYSISEQDGKYIAELEFYSKHDGDQIENVWFDKEDCDMSFSSELCTMADNWDIDDFVLIWLNAKQHRPDICRLNARELVEDGVWIQNFLIELSNKISKTI